MREGLAKRERGPAPGMCLGHRNMGIRPCCPCRVLRCCLTNYNYYSEYSGSSPIYIHSHIRKKSIKRDKRFLPEMPPICASPWSLTQQGVEGIGKTSKSETGMMVVKWGIPTRKSTLEWQERSERIEGIQIF